MTQNINLFIAFIGGILTFFSPCFLPLVPAYLIYITGLSLDELRDVRARTIFHSIIFIMGFSVVFTMLGMAANIAGKILYDYGDIIRIAGGMLIVVLGFYLMEGVKLPFLDLERKITISSKPSGYVGTFLVGMVFALGWSPCVGPVLAGILVFACQSETVGRGMLLLTFFSLGLGLPLFLCSLAVNFFLTFLKALEKYLGTIRTVCGVFLVIIGALMVTNYFEGFYKILYCFPTR